MCSENQGNAPRQGGPSGGDQDIELLEPSAGNQNIVLKRSKRSTEAECPTLEEEKDPTAEENKGPITEENKGPITDQTLKESEEALKKNHQKNLLFRLFLENQL